MFYKDIDVKKIQGIIFDWGGVIIEEPSKDLQKYCSTRLECNPDLGPKAIEKTLSQYQESRITENEMWTIVCKIAHGNQDILTQYKESSLWEEAVRNVFQFQPRIEEAIIRLQEMGIQTGFLSNTEEAASRIFYEKGMDSWFDAAILSCEVKLSKPDQEIYNLCARKLDLTKDSLLMLDDRIENIEGAINAGMQGILVGDISELADWLDKNYKK